MGNQAMIQLENIGKKFPRKGKKGKDSWHWAVKDLSLSVQEGEIFALLGPNGAGKTTTIRMLTMQTMPTEGRIFYGSKALVEHREELKACIGVVPQHINFDQDLMVEENLDLHGRLHHMSGRERKARIDELLSYMELEAVRHDNVRRLSGGMKRRLLILRALMHRPKILFLDEPTVALDPQVRRRIWELIRQMAKDGVTIFLTTHYIEEAEALCDRVAILSQGKLIAINTPQVFCKNLGAFAVEWEDGEREYRFFQTKKEATEFAGAIESDAAVLIRRTNLEDVFIELTGKKVGL